MAENKDIKNIISIADSDLEKIIGGLSPEEADAALEEVGELLNDVGKTAQNVGSAISKLAVAVKTNTCPYCNNKILPGADKCSAKDFYDHYQIFHK